MKMKRFCSAFLVAIMILTLLPSSLYSQSDTTTVQAAEADESSISTVSEETSETEEVLEDSDFYAVNAVTEETADDSSTATAEETETTETQDTLETTESETTEASESTASTNSDESTTSSSETEDSSDVSTETEDTSEVESETIEETYEETYTSESADSAIAETETTYSLSLSVTTKPASSSDDSIQYIKVTYPKLTTTVTDTETGEVISTTTKTYSLTVKVSLPSIGWVQINDTGSYYTYTTDSDSYIQAVNIKPSSSLKSALSTAGINFYYRATSEYLGQLGWAKAGQSAGSIGNKCPMTDLEFVISDSIPGSSEYRYISQAIVRYKTKETGSSSWNSLVANGKTSGKESTSYWIGSIAMDMDSDYMFDGDITYSARSSTSDASSKWTNWRTNYTAAGCGDYKLKAIKIKLTGDLADHFDVYYRVYLKGYGWLGWAKNGEKAGSHSTSLCICAVQIKLVPKGADAPGSTSSHYVSKSSSAKIAMIYAAQKYSSTSKYLIMVDRDNCRVGIFTGSKSNWSLKYYWECCVGKSSTPTPAGTYTVGIKEYSFGTSSYTCYYATQITGNYLFHSILYKAGTFTVKDGTLGEAVSHGCVRLALSNAKWIYNNIPTGTKIRIY